MKSSPKYYSEKLSAQRLRRCYEIAPPRVRQYLEVEIEHALERVRAHHSVLELGCGYGRVLDRIAEKARWAVGIDSSEQSLEMGRELMRRRPNCSLIQMDAGQLAFVGSFFDVTLCFQNGISAFKVDPLELMHESLRVTRSGGLVLFSSYADAFWPHRLEWFQIQADEGLLGEIDYEKTGNGVIECKDGFRATTFRPPDFLELTRCLGKQAQITEVDESSTFCEFTA